MVTVVARNTGVPPVPVASILSLPTFPLFYITRTGGTPVLRVAVPVRVVVLRAALCPDLILRRGDGLGDLAEELGVVFRFQRREVLLDFGLAGHADDDGRGVRVVEAEAQRDV